MGPYIRSQTPDPSLPSHHGLMLKNFSCFCANQQSDHSSKHREFYVQRRSDVFVSTTVFYVSAIKSHSQSHMLRKSPQLPKGAARYELGGPWVAFGSLASSEPAPLAFQSPPPPRTQNLTPQPAEGPSSVLNLNLEG